MPHQDGTPFARPYVVSWNLTYRCNLACEHCYLDAGGAPAGRHGELRRSERARHRGVLQGHRRNRRVRARVRDHPHGRRAAAAARHPRDRPARGGAWVVGGRRHQRGAHHREPGAASGGGRRARAVPVPRCARSRSARPLQEGAWRVAQHRGGGGDPRPDRPPLHRADDRGLAQSRRARRHRRLRARSPRRQGVEPVLPRADGTRAVRVGHHPGAVRRGARLAQPDPADLRPPDAREREMRAALHQDGPGAGGRAGRSHRNGRRVGGGRGVMAGRVPDQGLLRRGRRLPGRHALHGDPAERGCHPLPVPPRLRGQPSQLELWRTCGRRRSCSPTSAAARRSAGDAGRAS